MRSVVLAEDLMGLVLKLTRKSGNMGSLCVSWDVHGSEKVHGRKNLTRKIQIILSLCAGLLTLTILLFFLCRLDSAMVMPEQPWLSLPRVRPSSGTPRIVRHSSEGSLKEESKSDVESVALQGLGILFQKGTKIMSELVVAHLSDNVRADEFRLFLRTLLRSGVRARADIIFLFPWSPLPLRMRQIIQEEEEYFQKMLNVSTARFNSLMAEELQADDEIVRIPSNSSLSRFNFLAFKVYAADGGKNLSVSPFGRAAASDLEHAVNYPFRQEWGSVSGYEMAELDPSDDLAAFFEIPSADLRRWFCYQILLGMLKHKYKHVLLTEVGKVLILGDVFSAVRKSNALYLTTEDRTWIGDAEVSKHLHDLQNLSTTKASTVLDSYEHLVANESRQTSGNKASTDSQENEVSSKTSQKIDDSMLEVVNTKLIDGQTKKILSKQKKAALKDHSTSRTKGLMESVYGSKMWMSLETEEKQNKLLVSNVMLGAMRPIRALANVMAIEIVRVALQRRKKDAFSDQAPLNYLIHRSSFVLGRKVTDHILIVSNKESVIHSVSGSHQRHLFQRDCGDMYAVVTNFPSNALEQFGGLNLPAAINQDICSSPVESTVYKDCTHQRQWRLFEPS